MICYDLKNQSLISQIKNCHLGFITNIRHFADKLKKKENDKVIQLFAANLQHTYGDEMIVQQLGQDDSYIGQHLKVPSMITVHLMRLFCEDYEKNKKSWDNITIDSVLFLLSRIL